MSINEQKRPDRAAVYKEHRIRLAAEEVLYYLRRFPRGYPTSYLLNMLGGDHRFIYSALRRLRDAGIITMERSPFTARNGHMRWAMLVRLAEGQQR